jgi:hypothetical protein
VAGSRQDSRLKNGTAGSGKRTLQQPKVIQATFDQTENNILPGPEVIFSISNSS